METWTNKEGLVAKVGFCPYHPETKLDNNSECEKCLEEIVKRGKTRN